MTDREILGCAVMVRGYRRSIELYPNEVVGVMPLVDCDGDLGDAFNRLLDELDPDYSAFFDDDAPVAGWRRRAAPIIQKFLTGLRDVCVLLAVYERCGIIHNDLKPENIAIDRHGRGRLLDHELAELASEVSPEVRGGTLAYASPERREREFPYDTRSDLFSLGRVLAEVFLGRVPNAERVSYGHRTCFDLFPEVEEATEATLGSQFVVDVKRLVYPTPANDFRALTSKDPSSRPSALTVARLLQSHCDANNLLGSAASASKSQICAFSGGSSSALIRRTIAMRRRHQTTVRLVHPIRQERRGTA